VSKGGFQESVKSLNQAFFDEQLEVHPECEQLIYQLKTGKLNKAHKDFERASKVGKFIGHHCDGIAAAMYGWRMRDVSRIRVMPKINPDTQWASPKFMEQMMNQFSESNLEALRPKIKRF